MDYTELLYCLYNTEYAEVVLALAIYDDIINEDEAEDVDLDKLHDILMDADYITTVVNEDIKELLESEL